MVPGKQKTGNNRQCYSMVRFYVIFQHDYQIEQFLHSQPLDEMVQLTFHIFTYKKA